MKNKFLVLALAITLTGGVALPMQAQKKQTTTTLLNSLSQDKAANGLKEALTKGITDQVSTLTQKDGFFKNELVKILLPEEIQKVDKTLRKIGMGSLADQGLLLLNRAAESAVKEATPIFLDAVQNISFNDAKNILIGGESAATDYLQTNTKTALYKKFSPVINESLATVGADKVWETIFSTYNNLPLVSPVNTDLTDYVTNETMSGVFKMIAVEENKIRANSGLARNTKLLQDVFSIQDNLKKSGQKSTSSNSKDKKSEKKQEKKSLFKGLNIF
ncbi:DUF4197 domain-containing protein [Myroides phaeus]|uniref:DUF4197 domain-containing protein n=1 Tax=Myroides phaeus TaxID=702745 RepID=A0A1G8EJA9_9FLAO|nr:Protein of unknown function [Myroides phaeus]